MSNIKMTSSCEGRKAQAVRPVLLTPEDALIFVRSLSAVHIIGRMLPSDAADATFMQGAAHYRTRNAAEFKAGKMSPHKAGYIRKLAGVSIDEHRAARGVLS